MNSDKTHFRMGLACAVAAHVMWGLFPLFWRVLRAFDSLEIVSYRVLFAWAILLGCTPLLWFSVGNDERQLLKRQLRSGRIWLTYAAASLLIFTNWLVFIWAVGNDRTLEASLGYYINPLLNVVLGVAIMRESLSRVRWIAVAVAAVGVSILAGAGNGVPWVSLVLALSFSLYGLVKKQSQMPPLWGLLLETTTLLLPAVTILYVIGPVGDEPAGTPLKDNWIWFLFFVGGLITIMPLSLFAFAAKRVPLTTLGILQYIGPTLQFIIGVWILAEPFGKADLIGFVLVWAALIIYVVGPLVGWRFARPGRDPGAPSDLKC